MGSSVSGSPSCHSLILLSAAFSAAADGSKTPLWDAFMNPTVGGVTPLVKSSRPGVGCNTDAEVNRGKADALANILADGGSAVSGRGANHDE